MQDAAKPSAPTDFLTLARAFRKAEADVLFTPGYNGTPLAGRRQVFMIHDLIHFGAAEPGGFRKRLYYSTVTRAAAALGTVLTVSDASAAEITRRWPEARKRIRVAPNGLSAVFAQAVDTDPAAARSGLVLFTNNRWHKNLPRMLAAIAAWQAKAGPDADAPVWLVGPESPAQDLAARAGVRNASFVGRIDDTALVNLLLRARALLFCSLTEGFGLPLIEALTCGCAVVASDIGVFREVAREGCAWVDPNDTEAIAAGIEQAHRADVSRAQRADIASLYDWDRSYAIVAQAVHDAARL
ncbi:glycosyltransferase [Novosphingobium sp. NBM11]|uniref:glycosyltransferase n=1 Tax=Novosphingobium sp. NBM11 TaxID=2596914 RepID=UPI0018926128|nr:glycosyltransferase [Novosphingobium sp. NBM11]